MSGKIQRFTRWISDRYRKMVSSLCCVKAEEEEEEDKAIPSDQSSVESLKTEDQDDVSVHDKIHDSKREMELHVQAFARDYVLRVIASAKEKYLQELNGPA